jgi:hypothetical protein
MMLLRIFATCDLTLHCENPGSSWLVTSIPALMAAIGMVIMEHA